MTTNETDSLAAQKLIKLAGNNLVSAAVYFDPNGDGTVTRDEAEKNVNMFMRTTGLQNVTTDEQKNTILADLKERIPVDKVYGADKLTKLDDTASSLLSTVHRQVEKAIDLDVSVITPPPSTPNTPAASDKQNER